MMKTLCSAENARLRDRLMLGVASTAGFIFVHCFFAPSKTQVSCLFVLVSQVTHRQTLLSASNAILGSVE
jgi:hypothetical protein